MATLPPMPSHPHAILAFRPSAYHTHLSPGLLSETGLGGVLYLLQLSKPRVWFCFIKGLQVLSPGERMSGQSKLPAFATPHPAVLRELP